MKYVSEITKQTYNSEKECLAAEEAFKKEQAKAKAEKEKLTAERARRAKEVELAYKGVVEATNAYRDVLNKFVQDYGSFHMTYSNTSDAINDVFDSMIKLFY